MTKYLLIALIALMCSCTKTLYVPQEVKEIEFRDRLRVDSIYLRDSTVIRERGDTVFVYRDRYLYKDRFIHDTLFKRDSVSYPVYVDVVKEVNKLTWWQQLWCTIGKWAALGVAGLVIFKIKF